MFNKDQVIGLCIKKSCVNCGACVDVCPAEYLKVEDGKIMHNKESFGCIQCGHCMMVCPQEGIEILGDKLSSQDIIKVNKDIPNFEALEPLFLKRRSVRKFKNEVPAKEILDEIIQAASTAPISVPPSEVKVLVINGFDKVQSFADDIVDGCKKACKVMNLFVFTLFKSFMPKAEYQIFKEFVIPLMKYTIEAREKDKDVLFYNAPTVMLFYGTEFCGKEDGILAAAYATLAVESLGLGSCIIGSVPPIMANNAKLREKYGIKKEEKPIIAMVIGYPETKFLRQIKRPMNEVRYL